jgi:myo-inositol-1(or 4)-monophosphatase
VSGRRIADDPVELERFAARVASEAAELVAAGRRRAEAEGVGVAWATKSTATDAVTEFDRASERLIVERIAAGRPDDGILGEEGASATGTTGIRWLIDPIDGTTNFLYGLPGYAVSIAARDEAGGLVGSVVIPATSEVYSARRGGGAWRNGRPIRCSSATELASALVATGFSYQPARRRAQAERIARLIDSIRDIRRSGSAAADLCSAASGRVDAYFEEHLGPWDLAAGEVIAREAGCRLGGVDGGACRPKSVLVAAPGIFDALAELLQRAAS